MEHLYKAKRKDNGEWVYGSYVVDEVNDKHYIHDNGSTIMNGFEEVVDNTVCEYVGIDDKNKNKIFENDIVECAYCSNEYGNIKSLGYVCWVDDLSCYCICVEYVDELVEIADMHIIEVIGSIAGQDEEWVEDYFEKAKSEHKW